ncbi:uncharacterized protein LOC120354926 [Nilaparvata lugens]|uniref:uncharacterized protein LOC120354926 n=1 Tax=Nilaparvata lugens TaxID=108931 RepID=UPI00193DBF7F|nr:uncharacterized protein LOC120354926 [Nilaparvata lugens]
MIKIKSLFRRGHTGPSGGKRQNRPDDFGGHLGASAVPNNNEPPMRPAASVSSLDSKHYKIGSLPPQPQKWLKPALNDDSNPKKMDVDYMKTEFDTMVQEKANLEARVQELIRCHGEVETLRMEIAKLKVC